MNHAVPAPDWDEQVAQLGGGILQSRRWAEFQHALGRPALWAAGEGWQWLAFVRRSHGLRYLFCPYGPLARDEATMIQAITSLRAAGVRSAADLVRLEPPAHAPTPRLQAWGAQRIDDVDPAQTQIVDLTQDEAQLRAALSSGHRNLINGTERRQITIRPTADGADLEHFLAMLADTARRSGVVFYPPTYYRQLTATLQPAGVVQLYRADAAGQPVASALFYDWGGTRYYAHAGAYQEANRQAKAAVSLVWQALLDAKAAGLQRFDLWGVAPPGDSAHRLATLSQFKTAFGGTTVSYGGTWDIPLKPLRYRAYRLYRRLRGRH